MLKKIKEWFKEHYCQILVITLFFDMIGIALGFELCKLIAWCFFYWQMARMISRR